MYVILDRLWAHVDIHRPQSWCTSPMRLTSYVLYLQVKEDFKAASDEGHQQAEQKAADAHGKTSSFLTGLSEQVGIHTLTSKCG